MDNSINKEKALEFIQSEYDGYSDVDLLGKWESFEVYTANTNEDTDGDGVYVLVDDEQVRFADHDEADDLMHYFEIETDDDWYERRQILPKGPWPSKKWK